MTLRAVTLDATHTLFHAPRMAEIYAEVLGRHGLPLELAVLRPVLREVWQEFSLAADPRRDRFSNHAGGALGFWRRFVERLCEHLEAPSVSRFAVSELYERFARAEAWQVYPDATAALAALRARGLRVAVVSNWDERLPRLLDALGLGADLDAVVTSQEAGVEKPHAEIFRLALARLGVEPEHALHVGDDVREDIEGAAAIGMGALRLDRSRRDPAALATLAELPARLW